MLDARTAALLVLRQGPTYGRGLVRRIAEASGGQVRFGEGSIYPALQGLTRAGLVRAWPIVPGRQRGGRVRRYYELTGPGVRASQAAASGVAGLLGLGGVSVDTPAEVEARAQRIALGAELSETALILKPRLRRTKKVRGVV